MIPVAALWERMREELARVGELWAADLLFGRRDLAFTLLLVLVGVSVAMLLLRWALRRGGARNRIGVPALLGRTRGSWLGPARHLPLLCWVAGLPLFALALAEPYITLAEEEVSHPGRRIALLIDASSSMLAPFPASKLGAKAPNEAAFFTTVAAADAFIRQRKGGQYRDLVALIEFGDEAYVVTPFTTDYDNVLLSASLIGDWGEFMHFPNQGTTIGVAIDRATGLFRAFNFAEAAGNLMVIFSDGQDTQVQIGKTAVSDIMAQAIATKIPVYLIRTSRGKMLGEVVPDSIWKPAVESTGGRFYAAANENDVLKAIQDIDKRSPGSIRVKRYSTNQPRFAPFALAAVVAWTLALVLQLTLPFMRTFP
ncbi:MAG: VWA domain-containing protein [Acidimicrobiia bacterium]|nr:VWA domain-containing protein [Acidimicrobiia bacterium]